jgi:hypothetical protein
MDTTWTQVIILKNRVSLGLLGVKYTNLYSAKETIRDTLILYKEHLSSNLCTQKDAFLETLVLE